MSQETPYLMPSPSLQMPDESPNMPEMPEMPETHLVPLPKFKSFTDAFGSCKLKEHFNVKSAMYLLETWDEHADKFEKFDNNPENTYDPKLLLENFVKSAKGNDFIYVKYNKSNNAKRWGRWFAEKGLSFQSLPRVVRHTLCRGLWLDSDFKNCHPVILACLCAHYHISCHFLQRYNNNREEMLAEIIEKVGCTRDDAKRFILKALNGGAVNIAVSWWKDLKKEFENIASTLANREEYKKIKANCIEVKNINVNARVMNSVLCIYENLCLERMYQFLTDHGIIKNYNCCLVFDGLQVADNAFNRSAMTPEFLASVSKYIQDNTGIYLEIVIKDFDEFIEVPDDYESTNTNSNSKAYENVKVAFEKEHCYITSPACVVSVSPIDGKYEMRSIRAFKESFIRIQAEVEDRRGDGVRPIQFIDRWLKDETLRECHEYNFLPPPRICPLRCFNAWQGFKIAKEPLIETERDFYQEFYTYGLNLIGSKEVLDFLIARYAFRLQNPGLRTHVCLVLCGCEGDGKNRFLQVFYNLFEGYCKQIGDARRLYDNHSSIEAKQLFICVNEAGGSANFENADMLKSRISEPTLNINPKGINAYDIDNMCDYDNTTNNLNVLKLSDESMRRFIQVETTTFYQGNGDFFKDYCDNIENNTVALRQIYEALINFDVEKIVPGLKFQEHKPSTEIEEIVKLQNRDKVLVFIDDFTKNHMARYEVKYNNDHIFSSWLNWCDDNRVKIEYNKIQFGIKITQVLKKSINKKFTNLTKEQLIERDSKHSKTILYINNLKKFFKQLKKEDYDTDDDDDDGNEAQTIYGDDASNTSTVSAIAVDDMKPQKKQGKKRT